MESIKNHCSYFVDFRIIFDYQIFNIEVTIVA